MYGKDRTGQKNEVFSAFQQNEQALLNYANSFLLDWEDSRDVVQETFVRVWDKMDKLQNDSSIKSYIYSVVRNQCLNLIKRKKVERRYLELENTTLAIEDTQSDFISEDPGNLQRLYFFMKKMPPRTRRIFHLSRFQNYSNAEIARILNIKKRTVEIQISNGLRILREQVKREQNLGRLRKPCLAGSY